MVELKRRRFGLDINGPRMTLASRSIEAGLNVIDFIEDVDENSLAEKLTPYDGDLYFSVGENNALIKRIAQPYEHGLDETAVARFEFSSSLLDDPDKYFIDIHDVGPVKTKLAIGYNKSRVDDIISRISKNNEHPTGFKLRSLALAQAYLNLCQAEGGRLVCLLDISETYGAYCFIHEKTPVLPGALRLGAGNGDNQNGGPAADLLDLAAMVQFQLAGLAKSGLSDPLSRLIVSGPRADDVVLSRLEKSLHVSAGPPRLIKTAFKDDLGTKAPDAMIAIGLTIG